MDLLLNPFARRFEHKGKRGTSFRTKETRVAGEARSRHVNHVVKFAVRRKASLRTGLTSSSATQNSPDIARDDQLGRFGQSRIRNLTRGWARIVILTALTRTES